jgi:histidinol-phosphate/aromatic aminotransferase/cobyric acid decarboxylase-like protein
MDRFVRVSIGQEFENDAFIEATKKIKGSRN